MAAAGVGPVVGLLCVAAAAGVAAAGGEWGSATPGARSTAMLRLADLVVEGIDEVLLWKRLR